jgi:hypothetical protein
LPLEGFEQVRTVRHTVILPVPGTLNRVVLAAVEYATSISADIIAVHVNTAERDHEEVLSGWRKFVDNVPLIILDSPQRSVVRPLVRLVDEFAALRTNDKLTVVMPEFVPDHWWQKLLHNQIGLLLKEELELNSRIIVTSVPYCMKSRPQTKTEL